MNNKDTTIHINNPLEDMPTTTLQEEEAVAAALLTVDANVNIAAMKPEILGTNIGLWTNHEFHPASERKERYVNLIKEAGISLIRFPAGSEADYAYWDRTNAYEWHKGPDPYIRTITAETLDSFISLAREVGAAPLITVNAKIKDKDMAADMVRYANIEQGYGIVYWEIGNEPEFFGEPFGVTPEEYAETIKDYIAAMKAVDPSIVIIGPANAQPAHMSSWTKPILNALKAEETMVDAISVHWYPLWGEQPDKQSSSYPTIENLLTYEGNNYQNAYISWANQFTNSTPGDNLAAYREQFAPGALIGITELGQVTGGNEGDGIGNTMAGALWLGDVLGRLAYHGIDFVTQFLMQGNQAYGLIDMNQNVRPAYYLYPMLTRYFGDQMVASSSSDNQNLTVWASKRSGDSQKLYLMIINKHATDDIETAIALTHFNPSSTALAWTLNASSIDTANGINLNGVQVAADGTLAAIPGTPLMNISNRFVMSFPAHSVTMIELTSAR